jgi:hypothetical protein
MAVDLKDLEQTSLKRTRKKSIKLYKLWSLYKFRKKHLRRVWISINIVNKLSSIGQTLDAKTHKKCCHVGILEGLVLWLLASSIKAERTNFYSPPITLLESFVHLADGHSMKCP